MSLKRCALSPNPCYLCPWPHGKQGLCRPEQVQMRSDGPRLGPRTNDWCPSEKRRGHRARRARDNRGRDWRNLSKVKQGRDGRQPPQTSKAGSHPALGPPEIKALLTCALGSKTLRTVKRKSFCRLQPLDLWQFIRQSSFVTALHPESSGFPLRPHWAPGRPPRSKS